MKRSMVLLVIVSFILFSSVTYAFVQLKMEDSACTTNEGFKLKVSNLGDEDFDLQKTKVIVNLLGLYQGQGMDKGDLDPRGVSSDYDVLIHGTWDSSILEQGGYSLFLSEENILTYPGTYRVAVYYDGCKYRTFKGCTSDLCIPQKGECYAEGIVHCLGQREYGCKALQLSIDSCVNEQDQVTIAFHGLDKGLFTQVNPLKDVGYSFFGSRTNYDSKQELPQDMTVKEVGEDQYLLRFGLVNGNVITRVGIYNWACGSQAFKQCTTQSAPALEEQQIIDQGQERTSTSPSEEGGTSTSYLWLILLVILGLVLYNVHHMRKLKRHLKVK